MAESSIQKEIEKLYGDYHDDLRAFLYSKEKDHALVDDTIQETFIKLHLFLAKGEIITNTKSWLFRVSQNLLTDHYRSIKKQKDLPASEESEPVSDNHRPADCLQGIVASLPYKYKKAIYLVDIKGIKQTEAAVQLGISLPTFKSHVQRGRKLVAKGFMDCCDYEMDEKGHLQGAIKDRDQCKVCK